jgi:hypothetical protein
MQNNIESLFVPYEQALELKELGFDEPCFGYYDNFNIFIIDRNSKIEHKNSIYSNNELYKGVILAPLYQQAFRFFREKHDLVHRINRDGGWWICAILDLYDENDQGAIETYLENTNPQTYEEAETACLLELINICKK